MASETELPHFGTAELAGVRISSAVARALDAQAGDLLYITDPRWWTGGLHSAHVIVAAVSDEGDRATVAMEPTAFQNVVGKRVGRPVRLERLYQSERRGEGGDAAVSWAPFPFCFRDSQRAGP